MLCIPHHGKPVFENQVYYSSTKEILSISFKSLSKDSNCLKCKNHLKLYIPLGILYPGRLATKFVYKELVSNSIR